MSSTRRHGDVFCEQIDLRCRRSMEGEVSVDWHGL